MLFFPQMCIFESDLGFTNTTQAIYCNPFATILGCYFVIDLIYFGDPTDKVSVSLEWAYPQALGSGGYLD